MIRLPCLALALTLGLAGCLGLAAPARAASPFLAGIKKLTLLTSTEPANGDQNPYALIVAPVSAGEVRQGDVLIDDFNNEKNFQGTGTSIIDYRPQTGAMRVFATLPATLPGCPGGVGLSTAMVMLKSGWVIVGSAPSTDGTSKTLGHGCLILLDSDGRPASTISGPDIDDPWGNMAVIDHGDHASLFISNVGFGIGDSGDTAPRHRATVLRLDLVIPPAKPPVVASRIVIADGFAARADPGVFLIGPTGLALGPQGELYVSDALGNRIVAIPDAATRKDSAGTFRQVSAGGRLNRPLALTVAPDGDLLAVNGLDGNVVEINPKTGLQPTEN